MARQGAGKARLSRLWKEFFRDPSQWLDCRRCKSHPKAPDFLHKTTNEPLWLHSPHLPSWVLELVKFQRLDQPPARPTPLQDKRPYELCLNDALLYLEQRSHDLPSVTELACILQKCQREGSQEHALHLRNYIEQKGFASAVPIGNDLVSTLVKFGCIHEAHDVFSGLSYHDEGGFNSLIMGYCKSEEPHQALELYKTMEEEYAHLSLTGHTIVALLNVCAVVKDLRSVCSLHADVVKQELLGKDVYIDGALIDSYAKCGALVKAQEVFDKLLVRDVVSWTSLIAGYVKHGFGIKVLYLFEQMQQQGIAPDVATYVCILKACGMVGNTSYGQSVTQNVFGLIGSKDLIFWNALLAGYAEQGFGAKSLKCYEDMQQEGISPNRVTYLSLLKACGSIGDMSKGQEIHAEVAKNGLDGDPAIGCTLVDVYIKCGSLEGAAAVFDKIPRKGVATWNALMAGYANNCSEKVLDCLENMQLNHISPDSVTFVSCLKACSSVGDFDAGHDVHLKLVREGLDNDVLVGSSLISMYGKFGMLCKARKVFDKLPSHDSVSWNALINANIENKHYEEALTYFDHLRCHGIYPHASMLGCILKACACLKSVPRGQKIETEIVGCGIEGDTVLACALLDFYSKCGLLAEAQVVFDRTPIRDVALWNALISGYASFQCFDKALAYFVQMQCKGVCPDNITYASILKACSKCGSTQQHQELHSDIARKGLEIELFVGSALVNAYSRCGSLMEAQNAFSMLPKQDVVSWTTIIMGYALQLGSTHSTTRLFERMIRAGIEPNVITLICVLNALSHSGLVDKGQSYFESIDCPAYDHYACMLDLLGRAGFMEESVAVIKNMPFHPGSVVWDTMLGACRKWGSLELGQQSFKHAVMADKNNAAAYISLANIYADAAVHDSVLGQKLGAMP